MSACTLSSFSLYGRKAVLVLEDKDGEFEVENAFKLGSTGSGDFIIDASRVADAIDARNRERSAPQRPVY